MKQKKTYNNGKNSPKFIDLTNKKFGKLTAINYIQHITKHNNKKYMWECVCDCGESTLARTNELRNGTKTQCKKCSVIEASIKRTLPNNQSLLNRIYRNYKRASKNRNQTFSLTKEQFNEFLLGNCFYCGDSPKTHKGEVDYMNEEFKRNGIDRIDSNIGYIESNCVTCCETCNRMKMEMNYNEFIEKVFQICFNMEKRSETIPYGSTPQANGGGNSTSLNERLI